MSFSCDASVMIDFFFVNILIENSKFLGYALLDICHQIYRGHDTSAYELLIDAICKIIQEHLNRIIGRKQTRRSNRNEVV